MPEVNLAVAVHPRPSAFDPRCLAGFAQHRASKSLAGKRDVMPVAILVTPTELHYIDIAPMLNDPDSKDALAETLQVLARRNNALACMICFEAWLSFNPSGRASEDPERTEVVNVCYEDATRAGVFTFPIVRAPDGSGTLGEPLAGPAAGRFTNILPRRAASATPSTTPSDLN